MGFSCGALAVLGSEHVTASAIRTAVQADQATIRDFVTWNLTPEDLRSRVIAGQEALARLVDAAGTQLDANLVVAFVNGIETDPNAPLPGSDRPSELLWTPASRAA